MVETALDRHRYHPRTRNPVRERLARWLVDTNDCHVARALIGEHARLHRNIPVHAAMAIEVIGRDIGEDAGIGLERRCQIDLE